MPDNNDFTGPHPPAPEAEDYPAEDYPVVACPRCGREQHDLDGFGFVYCPAPACRYCTHPHLDGPVGGPLVCGICGAVEPDLGQGDA